MEGLELFSGFFREMMTRKIFDQFLEFQSRPAVVSNSEIGQSSFIIGIGDFLALGVTFDYFLEFLQGGRKFLEVVVALP